MSETIAQILLQKIREQGVLIPDEFNSIPGLEKFLPFDYANYMVIMARVRKLLPAGCKLIEAGSGSKIGGVLPIYKLSLPPADD